MLKNSKADYSGDEEQRVGSVDGKLLRESTRSKGDSGQTDLTRLLLKASQGDKIRELAGAGFVFDIFKVCNLITVDANTSVKPCPYSR